MPFVAEVSVPLRVNQIYSYLIPERFGSDIIGKRVIVNFSNKIITGLVVNVTSNLPDIKLKEISDVVDKEPIADISFLKLCKWTADYYLCSLGEVFMAAFPPKTFPQEEIFVKLSDVYNEIELTKFKQSSKKREELINLLTDADEYIALSTLKNKYGFRYSYKQYLEFRDSGYINISYEMKEEHRPKIMVAVRPSKTNGIDDKYIHRIGKEYLSRSAKQMEAFDSICNHYLETEQPILQQTLINDYNISAAAITALEKKGLIEKVEIEVSRVTEELSELSSKVELDLELADFQKQVLVDIRNEIENGKKNILIHGITGSGKTLIYMHLIRDVISAGKQVVMLLPEISLTPQLTDRFKLSFPGRVCTIHSKLNKNERYELWQQIANGEYDIVIGPRSTIFSPMKNIGLIIVDEEHDQSYKQDSPAPRYNARDLATVRGHILDCPVLFGSATPSLETYYNAKQGKYGYYQMTERADSHKLPTIELVDLLNARKTGGMHGSFSYGLIEQIKSTLVDGRKVMLFQNRRGHSSFVQCQSCAHIPQCEDCDIAMTYHSHSNVMICHYCGHKEEYTEHCKGCGADDVMKIGLGTQQVEDEINEILGDKVTVVRYDSDTVTNKNKQRQILQKFTDGGIDILVGTQMIAKGLDFSTIGLVGILNADVDLFISDIRAAEKTYQLINQVAGRAGRSKNSESKVILQTTVPNNYAIKTIKQMLNLDFLGEELQHREYLSYPPFSRLVVIEMISSDYAQLERQAMALYKTFPKDKAELDVLPPTDPVIKKVRKKYRKIIVIKNSKLLDPTGKVMRKYVWGCVDFYTKQGGHGDLRININVDASSVM
ncbi:MAG: primosomal protein N' [Ignavibacteriae bacterium]|nr:primosomal protein N' [Ignavibacteriota bacterium]MCB9220380.1 primosomal protein N' [Ignavibacteria bacterium]